MSESINAEYDTYRFVAACKSCGVVDEYELTSEQASGTLPVENDPAKLHWERTGHTCTRLCYTKAPADIREMLDAGGPEDIDWKRVGEWLKSTPE